MRTMTQDEFYEQFHPVKNHLVEDAPFDGCMFETFGEELDYIHSLKTNNKSYKHVWTILEDDGKLYYSSGYHFINRMGYLVTKEEWNDDIEVNLDEEE